MITLSIYLGLFLVALLAATILPMQSEAMLVALIIAGKQPVVLLILAASLGNILGSIINWWLGCFIEGFHEKRWFPVKKSALDRAKIRYHRFGRWSLLLCWVPIIGDPLTVIAGVMREPLWSFVLIVSAAKITRYIVIAMITVAIQN